tara:strand:- start:434 stop:688 length:255 start_codon:yes stop_codon:yes gene_type:complete
MGRGDGGPPKERLVMLRESESGRVRPAASSHYKPGNAVAYLSRLAKKRASIEGRTPHYAAVRRHSQQYDEIRRSLPQLATFMPP